jgi:hypothetical protein
MSLRASGLQFLLNEVDQYSNKWRFTFSPSKSKIIIFCLRKHHVNLLLQGFRSVSPDVHQMLLALTKIRAGLRIESFACSNKFTCMVFPQIKYYMHVLPPCKPTKNL